MDMSAVMHESMVMDEGKKICPFRSSVGSQCMKEKCAMWYKKTNDSGEDVSKCGFLMSAYALAHLATVGMDVFPS